MALFHCQECENKISLTAVTCPKCGSSDPFSTEDMISLFWDCKSKIYDKLPSENIIIESMRMIIILVVMLSLMAVFAILLYGFLLQSLFYYFNFSENVKYFTFLFISISSYGAIFMVGLISLNHDEDEDKIIFRNYLFDIDKIIINYKNDNKKSIRSCIDKISNLLPKINNEKFKKTKLNTEFKSFNDFRESLEIKISTKNIVYAYICDILIKSIMFSSLILTILTATFIVYFFISNPNKIVGNLLELSTSPELFAFIGSLFEVLPNKLGDMYAVLQSSLIRESSMTLYVFLPIIIYIAAFIICVELFTMLEFLRLIFGRHLKEKLKSINYMNHEFQDSYDRIKSINKVLT